MADHNGARKELKDSLLDSVKDAIEKKQPSRPKSSRFRRCRSAPSYEPPSNSHEPTRWVPGKSLFGSINPSFRLIGLLFVAYLLIASISFYFVGNQMTGRSNEKKVVSTPSISKEFGRAFQNRLEKDLSSFTIYFTIVTMTTVGYGDLVPNSDAAKLLACAFVFLGMAVVGLFLSKAADRLVEKQEVLIFKALNMRMKDSEAKMLKSIETNKSKYKFYATAVVLVLLIAVGTVFLWKVEKLDFIDSFYCVCSTITTLGYGDKSFSSEWGRAFAVVWIVVSTLFLAQFFFYLAEWTTEHKQKKLAKWALTRRTTNLDLEAADFDGNHIVGAPEFIIYKLKEMGKITQEDISVFLEEFENLDADQSGTLSTYDLMVAQQNQKL